MSSLALLTALRTWNNPAAPSSWRSFAPVMLLDWRIYWQNKKRIEVLYRLDKLDDATEEEFEELLALLDSVVSAIDGYLRVRGTGHALWRRISHQRDEIVRAIEAIKRGYAPGKLPHQSARVELANERLHHIGVN